MKYKLIKNVKEDSAIRHSFNDLTGSVFGFSLEEWYSNGYWSNQYIPYSLVEENRVVANVSVNLMEFVLNGVHKNFIQLGTVMTREDYRNQGLGRILMEEVLTEYRNQADGIYLFANDSAVNFYPKFGFTIGREYRYSKKINTITTADKPHPSFASIQKVDMNQKEYREKVLNTTHNMAVNNNLHMDNTGLYSFYLTGFMNDQVYYCETEEAYAVANIQENTLYLNQIISNRRVDLDVVIASFGIEINEVILGFTPLDIREYDMKELKEEDCTLFVLGEKPALMDEYKLRFPVLSHA